MAFETTCKCRFFHCDSAGVMFYSRIFELAHEAYETCIESAHSHSNWFESPDWAAPIVSTNAVYNSPIHSGDLLRVRLLKGEIKNTSFQLKYEFDKMPTSSDPVTRVAEVDTRHVFIDKSNGQPIPPPDQAKTFFEFLQ